MQSNLKPISEKHFIGMNDKYPAETLPPGVFQLIQNAVVDSDQIAKRYGTTAASTSLGAHAILGLSPYEPVAGTKYLIALLDGASNSQLYKWSGSGSWSTLSTAQWTTGVQMNFVQASNILYGFNGTDVVSIDSSLTVTKNPATVPLGGYAAWFHNFLFVANTTGFPNRLFFSNLGDPTTFVNTNFVDINPNDGDQITGLAVFNDELYIFKNNTIWSLSGFSGSTFSATTIAGQNTNSKIFGYGTPAQKSIIVTGRDMYYLSYSGGVPHIRSFVQTSFATVLEQGVISYDLETTMRGLSLSNLSKTAGVYDGKYCYWAVPNGGSSTNNLVLVLEPTVTLRSRLGTHRCWTKFTGINPAMFANSDLAGQETIYFGDSTTGGFVFRLNDTSVFSDNGVAIVMTIQTRAFRFDVGHKAKWKYCYTRYKTGSSGSLQVNARIDQATTFTTQDTISLAGNSPGLGSFIMGTSTLGGSGVSTQRTTFAQLTSHLMMLQYLESTANAANIYDYEILAFLKGFRA